jgi:CheY-like chemotaxis protein
METDRSICVLVVDDHEVNRIVAVTLLQQLGCKVESVDCGQDAVDAVRAGAYDVIFMDFHMPSMDGIQATEAIRSLVGDRASTPIVAVTADVSYETKQKCLAAGMDAYITKPIRKEELIRVLKTYCP